MISFPHPGREGPGDPLGRAEGAAGRALPHQASWEFPRICFLEGDCPVRVRVLLLFLLSSSRASGNMIGGIRGWSAPSLPLKAPCACPPSAFSLPHLGLRLLCPGPHPPVTTSTSPGQLPSLRVPGALGVLLGIVLVPVFFRGSLWSLSVASPLRPWCLPSHPPGTVPGRRGRRCVGPEAG